MLFVGRIFSYTIKSTWFKKFAKIQAKNNKNPSKEGISKT